MSGEALPYLLRSDGMVTSVLFLSLVLVAYVLSKGKKILMNQLQTFVTNRERGSIFDEATSGEVGHTFFLMFHSCMVWGMFIYYYYSRTMPELFQMYSHGWLLAGYIGGVVGLFVFKCLIYSLVNWAFFDKTRNTIWMSSYYNVTIWQGILLLPIVLLVVYFDLSFLLAVVFACFLFFLVKLLLFFKCFSNFYENFHGAFHLILYLCTLEILPDFFMWKAFGLVNDFLLITNT